VVDDVIITSLVEARVTCFQFEFVLDHPTVNSYFRYQSRSGILDKILGKVLEQ